MLDEKVRLVSLEIEPPKALSSVFLKIHSVSNFFLKKSILRSIMKLFAPQLTSHKRKRTAMRGFSYLEGTKSRITRKEFIEANYAKFNS